MVGSPHRCHLTVFVASPSQYNMHSVFPSIRHNVLQDLTASLRKPVMVLLQNQRCTSETFRAATANKQDGARLDIVANGFWGGAFESF